MGKPVFTRGFPDALTSTLKKEAKRIAGLSFGAYIAIILQEMTAADRMRYFNQFADRQSHERRRLQAQAEEAIP